VETISAAALSGHDSQTVPRRDRGAAQAAASPEAAATASCSCEPVCSVVCQPLPTASP